MPDSLPFSQPLRTAFLSTRKPTRFDLVPDAVGSEALARDLGISAITGLRFAGAIAPEGRGNFALQATLTATVTQPCVVTLEPVKTRLDLPVTRRYVADFKQPDGDEAEMPPDDTDEPLPEVIDPAAVMVEALILALPDYPRAPGAALAETVHAAPGIEPLRDGDLRPFAGLAALAQRLGDKGPDDAGGPDE